MKTKANILENIDEKVLTEILIKLNNTPRYDLYYKNRTNFLEYASKKLTKEQSLLIIRGLNYHNKTINEIVREIREKSGTEIRALFIKHLNGVVFRKEFRVGERQADLVYLQNEDIVAIEIKANGDKIEAAKAQCDDYAKWANRVYLLIEEKREAELSKVKLGDFAGIIVYKGGKFVEVKHASRLEHDLSAYTRFMSSKALRNLARFYGIKSGGTKEQLINFFENVSKSRNILGRPNEKALYDAKKIFLEG